MEDSARIGYMPVRVWGCPTTAHWTYRLGPERAKRMTLTGDLIDGVKAADWGLVSESAVEWRDSGRPIPEGDEARKAIAELEAQIAESLGSKDARI